MVQTLLRLIGADYETPAGCVGEVRPKQIYTKEAHHPPCGKRVLQWKSTRTTTSKRQQCIQVLPLIKRHEV
ncbi:hypothetical protein CHH83_09495 [Bacillus sp. 7586-K]|nr:hypothetical protein CHH83_09495 [Bacillus sp. 7586-K]